eukprot:Polyplicarium_translucidae@DN2371_c0_g1_i1.p4
MGKNTRMQQWIGYRVRVTIRDSRMFVGTFMAFDRHMNVVLSECDEFRKLKPKGSDEEKEIKRALGFVLIRGGNVISFTAEAPPVTEPKRRAEVGAGRGAAVGRGAPVALGAAPAGLSGPVRGIGMPAPGMR